jgi:hypothetical protein
MSGAVTTFVVSVRLLDRYGVTTPLRRFPFFFGRNLIQHLTIVLVVAVEAVTTEY